MKHFCFFITMITLLTFGAFGQVGINSDGNQPDNSAMLDVNSVNRGKLVARQVNYLKMKTEPEGSLRQ